jgi:L-ornithine N5-oxygenase
MVNHHDTLAFAETLDLVGVGFGPAGIALAAALADQREAQPATQQWPYSARFFEARADSSWQSGLLLPGTDISHHFLRDLAMPRDPRSRFTFANYLKQRGRLFDFGLWRGAVSRIEWSDYITWAAAQLTDYVSYQTNVLAVAPHIVGERVEHLRVETSRGNVLAADLVVNSGQKAYIPEEFKPFLGERFFHTNRFLPMLEKLDREAPLEFLVVGSGQSAAESLLYLRGEFRHGRFHSLHRKVAFKLLDDGHFSQQIYFPEETDYFYALPLDQRRHALQDIWLTNYATIDWEVSQALYARMYEDKVAGRERIGILSRRKITDVAVDGGRFTVTTEDVYSGDARPLTVDVVILCTGYREELFPSCLEPLRPYLKLDEHQGLAVRRDYQVETVAGFRPRIYLNGLCERTHGMSDATSFSMMALKVEHIVKGLKDHRQPLLTLVEAGSAERAVAGRGAAAAAIEPVA